MENVGSESLTDAQKLLVESNVRLVYYQVHRRGIKSEDLIQEGMIGLINAARFYSPDFGVKFSTYASSYIWAALHGTYSDKKSVKNGVLTSSYDDPNLNIQPHSNSFGCGFFDYLSKNTDEITEKVCRAIAVEGLSKKGVKKLLNISSSQLNAILNKVGRDIYAERYTNK